MAKNHSVPRCYLEAWCDPQTPVGHEPYVHVYAKDGDAHKRRAPAKIFKLPDLYDTDFGGQRSDALEKKFSRLEGAYSTLRRHKLEKSKLLTQAEYQTLITFAATLHQRTPRMMNHHMSHWNMIREIGEDMEKAIAAGSKLPRGFSSSASSEKVITLNQVRDITNRPPANLLTTTMQAELDALLQHVRFTILRYDGGLPGFITSDNPTVWHDPEAYKRPPLYQAPTLAYPSTEITMPISPRLCLFGTPNHRKSSLPLAYSSVHLQVVREFNRRVRAFCASHFIVATEHLDLYWLDMGEQPPDAWRALMSSDKSKNS